MVCRNVNWLFCPIAGIPTGDYTVHLEMNAYTRVTTLKVLGIIRPFDITGHDRLVRKEDMLESIRP